MKTSAYTVADILARVYEGARPGEEDAIRLFCEADLLVLGAAADAMRARLHPDGVATYIVDRNINYSNICASGCAFCARRCLYRHEVGSLVIDEVLERDFVSAMRETRDDQAMWRGLARLASDAAAQVVAVEDAAVAREAALCYATQMGARLGFSSANQRKLVKNVRRIMTSPARKGGG